MLSVSFMYANLVSVGDAVSVMVWLPCRPDGGVAVAETTLLSPGIR